MHVLASIFFLFIGTLMLLVAFAAGSFTLLACGATKQAWADKEMTARDKAFLLIFFCVSTAWGCYLAYTAGKFAFLWLGYLG